MTTAVDTQRDLIEATGRFAVYSLLANGVAFPTTARLELIGTRLLPAVSLLDLPDALSTAVQVVTESAMTDLDIARDDHMSLFPPIASQDAPGYETGYRGEGIFQQSALMADIGGFYRAHGLRAGGSERERLDHITVELEFMAVLARKEAVAIEAGEYQQASICRDTAALFLQDHLGCWAPAFGRRAAAVTPSAWFQNLGYLMALWVEHDMAAFGVEPTAVVEGPLPQEPPDDGACGPCPVGPGVAVP